MHISLLLNWIFCCIQLFVWPEWALLIEWHHSYLFCRLLYSQRAYVVQPHPGYWLCEWDRWVKHKQCITYFGKIMFCIISPLLCHARFHFCHREWGISMYAHMQCVTQLLFPWQHTDDIGQLATILCTIMGTVSKKTVSVCMYTLHPCPVRLPAKNHLIPSLISVS